MDGAAEPVDSLWTEPRYLWIVSPARVKCRRSTRKWRLKSSQIAPMTAADAQETTANGIYVGRAGGFARQPYGPLSSPPALI